MIVIILIQGNGVTYQIGEGVNVRPQFITNGTLANSQDNNFRAIGSGNNFPVFAFAVNLGQVSDTSATPIIFVNGLAPQGDAGCVQYQPGEALEDRYLYFLSEMSTMDAVSYTLTSYRPVFLSPIVTRLHRGLS